MSSVRITRRKAFQRIHPRGQNFTPQGAAHNYQIEVTLAGPADPETGIIINIREIDSLLDEALKTPANAATTEAFAGQLFAQLQTPAFSRGVDICKLRLFETNDYWVDVWP